MENLLEETKTMLAWYDKSPFDVRWIGCKAFRISGEQFMQLADSKYDSGFGGQEVAIDLLVVGEDWWLERHEYDGSEWWEYKQMPKRPEEAREIRALTVRQADHVVSGSTLEELQKS